MPVDTKLLRINDTSIRRLVYEYFSGDRRTYVPQGEGRKTNEHEEGTGLYTAAIDRYLQDQ